MLRTLVLLLVAANLVFLAWTLGLLRPLVMPPMSSEREPERLRMQVRPETIRLLTAQEAARARREEADTRAAPAAAPAGSAASAASAPRAAP